jgi:hypothetical protein
METVTQTRSPESLNAWDVTVSWETFPPVGDCGSGDDLAMDRVRQKGQADFPGGIPMRIAAQ